MKVSEKGASSFQKRFMERTINKKLKTLRKDRKVTRNRVKEVPTDFCKGPVETRAIPHLIKNQSHYGMDSWKQ